MKISMNILLLNPRLKTWSPNIWVPLGLAYIAAVLESEGHDVEIIDLNARQVSEGNLKRKGSQRPNCRHHRDDYRI